MRNALRSLAADPGFTVVATLTIALGIAANTAIFSVVNAVLLQPLPYPEAGRIVQVRTSTPDEQRSAHAAPDFLDFQRHRRNTVETQQNHRRTTGKRWKHCTRCTSTHPDPP